MGLGDESVRADTNTWFDIHDPVFNHRLQLS